VKMRTSTLKRIHSSACLVLLALFFLGLLVQRARAEGAPIANVSRPLNNVPGVIRDTIAKQPKPQQEAAKQEIQDEVDALQSGLNTLLAKTPRTPELVKQIGDASDALTVKKGALEIASGSADKASQASQESWVNTNEPFFLMCGDRLWTPTRDSSEWQTELQNIQTNLITVGHSVGLITLNDKPVGTGFVVGERYVITNKHVARILAGPANSGQDWVIKGKVSVIFDREYPLGTEGGGCIKSYSEHTYVVNGIAWTSPDIPMDKCRSDEDLPDGCNDVALLLTSTDGNYPAAPQIVARKESEYRGNMVLAVIGYPGPPRDMPHVIQEQFFRAPDTKVAQFGYKRLSAGDSLNLPIVDDIAFWHGVNTNGGSSGSPILDTKTGEIVGLHMAGIDRNGDTPGQNLGVTASIVIRDLQDAGVLSPPMITAATTPSGCLVGSWPEVATNGQSSAFFWMFTESYGVDGSDVLHVARNDGFVSGDFRPDQTTNKWSGQLKWGNNELWTDVQLFPSTDCKQVRTNQIWSYRRI